jgi:ATP-dependent RNA helicase DDX51/DBP6
VRVLVVDEADRLLRQDYQNWLPAVLAQLESGSGGGPGGGGLGGGADPRCPVPLLPFGQPRPLKLIVSATLTRDPSKLARLRLHCPRFIALTALGGRRYALPPGLRLRRVLAPAQHKPLALAALLHRLRGVPTLVFASSLETTHRCATARVCPCARALTRATRNRGARAPPL